VPDYSKRHKGIRGIHRLYQDIIQKSNIDYVIDLHDVLRSKVLRAFFSAKGIPTAIIDKGRKEKNELIHGGPKSNLKHTVERYADVFRHAGLNVVPSANPSIQISSNQAQKAASIIVGGESIHIGIAPFSKHPLKIWPTEKMIELMKMMASRTSCNFYLFGNRAEVPELIQLAEMVPQATVIAGKYSLEEELALMAKLKFMISMDSANMHMASLAGTKVISIWGSTDPMAGFGAWNQPEEFAVKRPVTELVCRPCTVFGKGECHRKDFACMNQLLPTQVMTVIDQSGLLISQ
jgi:ADP-heptose:LPS heptosyltransferase